MEDALLMSDTDSPKAVLFQLTICIGHLKCVHTCLDTIPPPPSSLRCSVFLRHNTRTQAFPQPGPVLVGLPILFEPASKRLFCSPIVPYLEWVLWSRGFPSMKAYGSI